MSIDETVEWFNSIYELNKMHGESKSAFYCGIANDKEEQRKQHNVSRFLGVTKCDTFETAKKLKAKMHDEGYDTMKQFGNETADSVYCYLYKKIAGITKE